MKKAYREGSAMRLVFDEIRYIPERGERVISSEWFRFNCISVETFRCCIHKIAKVSGAIFKTKLLDGGNVIIKRVR